MTGAEFAGENEPPAGAEEALLAEFLDDVLGRLQRGEAAPADALLGRAPHLAEQGRGLAEGARALLVAAAGLREHERQLQSDLHSLSAERAAGATTDVWDAGLPDPFPGEFRVLRRLGAGAFGEVWLAEDLHLGRPVALKTVRPGGSAGDAARRLARLRDEARVLAGLRCRHVVRVHAWRESAGVPYLVLQYVPGGSLADRVREEGPLPWQQAARHVADVAEGLREIHRAGLVHRDVKPANLLWDPEADEALLTDFGVAARLADAGGPAGTPFYMPPEAFAGRVGPAQDVYGLAATLFWLVVGAVPFPGPSAEEVVAQAAGGLPDPDERCAGLPAALERLMRRGLDPDPARRPSAEEFAAALRGALNQLLADSLAPPADPARPSPAAVRLTIYRQTGRGAFVPVAAARPPQECAVRDLKRTPREPERVDLRTGDRVRIGVEAGRPGYVTVFNVGPTGNLNVLQPAAWVEGGGSLEIPDVELTPPDGSERVLALWTGRPLDLPPDELRAVAERGEPLASGPQRATRDMRRVQESLRRFPAEDWCVAVLNLNHLPAGECAT
jgi:hypothetical protein